MKKIIGIALIALAGFAMLGWTPADCPTPHAPLRSEQSEYWREAMVRLIGEMRGENLTLGESALEHMMFGESAQSEYAVQIYPRFPLAVGDGPDYWW